jgi:uncharacterized coiled-coil DUF342 family protein
MELAMMTLVKSTAAPSTAVDKLLDVLTVYADVQNNTCNETERSLTTILQMRAEVQELHTDLLQLRAEFQAFHNDMLKLTMILSTPADMRYDFAKSLYETEFTELENDASSTGTA